MSPIQKSEQLGAHHTSTFRQRVASGELHFLANFNSEMMSSDQIEQYKSLEELRSKFGRDEVVTSNAMRRDGQPDGIPGMVGVYVTPDVWTKLHPEQNQ